MIDTFSLSKTFYRTPNENLLSEKGWKTLYSQNGTPRLVLNSEKNRGDPRLTIFSTPKGTWILKAEVSISSWLNGSNIHLPDEADFKTGLEMLSEFISDKSGLDFNAETERVTRVDFAHDFLIEESRIIPVITALGKISLPKYNRILYETGVCFKNAGKSQNKHYLIYSKYHEVVAKKKDPPDLARNRLRLEISHKSQAVLTLAESLKFPDRNANHILTKETSERVISHAISLLRLDSVLADNQSCIENLFELYGHSQAKKLVSFLALTQRYGNNLDKFPFLNMPKRTCQKYRADCKKAGVLSLE